MIDIGRVAQQIFELPRPLTKESRNSLRTLRSCHAGKEFVSSPQNSRTRNPAFARGGSLKDSLEMLVACVGNQQSFCVERCLQSLFHKFRTFNADRLARRWPSALKRSAKFLQPFILAARNCLGLHLAVAAPSISAGACPPQLDLKFSNWILANFRVPFAIPTINSEAQRSILR